MALVPAICTQCGAQIEVDNLHDAGICKYCGTAFVTEKVINKYNTYITNNNNFSGATINIINGDIENCLNLAENALLANNEVDAIKYCEKALEIDVKSSKAWFLKMKAEKIKSQKSSVTVESANFVKSIAIAGNNSIAYDNSEDKTHDVHLFYLQSVRDILIFNKLAYEVTNISTIKTLATSNKALAQSKDQMLILALTAKDVVACGLLDDINLEEFEKYKDFREILIECINSYVGAKEAYVKRILIYGSTPLPKAVETMKSWYDKMVNILHADEKEKVVSWSIKPNLESESNSNEGCYIATCVYGSYDCPEVWTLRRFRDNILDSTWYGKVFIKCYYFISPKLVNLFGKTNWFQRFWKRKLDIMVKNLNQQGISDKKYKDKY